MIAKLLALVNPWHLCRYDSIYGKYFTRSGAHLLLRCRCGKPKEVEAK